MNPLLYPIVIPILIGIVCVIIPRGVKVIRELLALVGSAGTFGLVIWLFTQKPLDWTYNESLILSLDDLSSFILLASGLFGFLITLYSIRFMEGKEQLSTYYGSLLHRTSHFLGFSGDYPLSSCSYRRKGCCSCSEKDSCYHRRKRRPYSVRNCVYLHFNRYLRNE